MRTSTVVSVVVVALIVVAGIWWALSQPAATPIDQTQQTATTTDTTGGAQAGIDVSANVGGSVSTAPMAATVTFSDAGFSPTSVTVAKGGTVTFTNTSSRSMWVAADEHPTHTEYDGTSRTQHCATTPSASFDQCSNGTTYSFTFTKAGTFNYHNHSAAQYQGTVVVQ